MRHFLIATLLAAPTALAAQQASRTLLFTNVRVFDGTRVTSARSVLVRDGLIAQVAQRILPTADVEVIDGSGKTLLPGFIDAHTHSWADATSRQALVFGVTTELDMFTELSFLAQMKAQQAAGGATSRSDIFSAGTLVTAPGGHGTEYGMRIPTITSPDSAQAFVDARIAEGSEWIKIVYDDGKTYGMRIPTISKETMRALVKAAHARGKLAVVHIGALSAARDAIDVGADGLVHTFVDSMPDADFAKRVAAHKAFVVPTLTVNMSITGTGGAATLVSDAHVAPYLTKPDIATLQQGFPMRGGTQNYAAAVKSVKDLRAAGVSLLAGTDAGNPGTAHGAALHREMELLVAAGLTPTEALAAATSAPARSFRLADRGRIAPGLRADLVLVNGDPTADITATRDIAGVWKRGVQLDRNVWRGVATASREERQASIPESGVISDFETGNADASFGSGWLPTLDQMAGGKSTGFFKVVDGGANGSAKALEVTGVISPALQYAWSGVMFAPGAQPMAAANLSSRKELRFWTKGDGKTYRVMVFTQSKGYTPLIQTFVAGSEWTEIVMPFSAFEGIDGHDIMGIAFSGGPNAGAFAFRIDDIRVR